MSSTLFMVDSIASPATTGQPIPQAIMTAPTIAGYLHGNSWPTYAPYAAARPDLAAVGRIVSITLTASAPARCLDVESGGAVASQAPLWFTTHADRSQGKPIIYTSASNVQTVINTMSLAGISRSQYLIWSAHYNFVAHICAPAVCGYPQADGTQYTDRVPGNCDGSIMFSYCFKPAPTPKPPGGTVAIAVGTNQNGRMEVFVEAKDGSVYHTWQDASGAWHGAKKDKTNAVWESLGTPGK